MDLETENNIDLEYRKEFLEKFKQKRRKTLVTVLIIGLTIGSGFGFLDYYVTQTTSSFLKILPTRIAIVLVSIIGFYIYKKVPKKIHYVDILGVLPIYFASIHIALVMFFTGGTSSPYAIGLLLMLFMSGFYVYCSKAEGLFLTLSITLLFVVSSLLAPGDINYSVFFAYFSVMLVMSFMTYHYTNSRYKLDRENFINQKRIEEKNKELQQLNETKTRFFTNITHEFRTPLVSLSTLLQMIKSKLNPDPELSSFLQSSSASLNEMLDNVNDLLSKTKSEKGFLEMRWSRIEPIDFFKKSVDVFMPLAAKKNIQIKFKNELTPSIKDKSEPLQIYGDRFKLKRVLNNLISNALKFTHVGKVEIIATADTKYLIIKVQDTGSGIPERDLPTIFDTFTQASNNELRDVKGTGLGLSIVKDFVEAHQGQVKVESKINQGTCFSIFLPLGDGHVDKSKVDLSEISEDEASQIIGNLSEFNEEIDLNPFIKTKKGHSKLLLVDDNLQVLQALSFVLQDEYNLNFAHDGVEGIHKAQEIKPDLIISDVMMPNKNGYEFLEDIKKDPSLKNIPFILLTAKVDLESKIKGLEEGANEYITKPFNNLEVKTRVKNLLDRKKLEAEFIHAEKMISLGQLVAGISHEILNPIAYAKNANEGIPEFIEAMEKGIISKEKAKQHITSAIARVKDGIERVCAIAEALKGVVRHGNRSFGQQDIHLGLDSTLKIVQVNFKNNIQIHKDYQLSKKAYCNINQINQVFLNLFVNASQAMETQKEANLWIQTSQENGKAKIVIRDDGPGIPLEIQNKIFDPFFTTKEIGKGTGLGLYLSQQIIKEHDGNMIMQSTPGQGTQFTITIPIEKPQENDSENRIFTHAHIDKKVAQIQYPYQG
ncbi:MAG: response regulator [Deltaproteobacteria bacterium]|nr:response regulator [Deltaproteobacteria bacterium]